MNYKVIYIKEDTSTSVTTEIIYEIAGAHAAGVELLKLNFKKADDMRAYSRIFAASVKLLKKKKAEGSIQFFATEQSFDDLNTEAEFLLNKYSSVINHDTDDEYGYIYVRV